MSWVALALVVAGWVALALVVGALVGIRLSADKRAAQAADRDARRRLRDVGRVPPRTTGGRR